MAKRDPNPERQDRNVEVPGDTGAADIVSRTGEEMPRQSHDGLEAEDRVRPEADSDDQDEVAGGHPV